MFDRVSDRFSDLSSRFSNRFSCRDKTFSGAISFCRRAALTKGREAKIAARQMFLLKCRFETQGRQTFEGGHELFDHHPFGWKTLSPTGGLRTKNLIFVLFFSCLNCKGIFEKGTVKPLLRGRGYSGGIL